MTPACVRPANTHAIAAVTAACHNTNIASVPFSPPIAL
jgi:hypothetical protein